MTNFDVFYLSFPGSLQHCMSALLLIAFRFNYIYYFDILSWEQDGFVFLAFAEIL